MDKLCNRGFAGTPLQLEWLHVSPIISGFPYLFRHFGGQRYGAFYYYCHNCNLIRKWFSNPDTSHKQVWHHFSNINALTVGLKDGCMTSGCLYGYKLPYNAGGNVLRMDKILLIHWKSFVVWAPQMNFKAYVLMCINNFS